MSAYIPTRSRRFDHRHRTLSQPETRAASYPSRFPHIQFGQTKLWKYEPSIKLLRATDGSSTRSDLAAPTAFRSFAAFKACPAGPLWGSVERVDPLKHGAMLNSALATCPGIVVHWDSMVRRQCDYTNDVRLG